MTQVVYTCLEELALRWIYRETSTTEPSEDFTEVLEVQVRVATKNKQVIQVTKYEGYAGKNTIYKSLEGGNCIAHPKW